MTCSVAEGPLKAPVEDSLLRTPTALLLATDGTPQSDAAIALARVLPLGDQSKVNMSTANGSRAGTTVNKTPSPKDVPKVERMLAATVGDVTFRELPRDEIEAMLLRNRVGRLAFSIHDRVDIQPIHYIYERGWLYGRTSEGGKIATLKHNQWVAFEVDEIADVFDWRSLVIHGSFWIMHPRGSPRAEELWAKAAELVSRIVPGALTDTDPVAFRQTLFRIAVGDVRGREAKVKLRRTED